MASGRHGVFEACVVDAAVKTSPKQTSTPVTGSAKAASVSADGRGITRTRRERERHPANTGGKTPQRCERKTERDDLRKLKEDEARYRLESSSMPKSVPSDESLLSEPRLRLTRRRTESAATRKLETGTTGTARLRNDASVRRKGNGGSVLPTRTVNTSRCSRQTHAPTVEAPEASLNTSMRSRRVARTTGRTSPLPAGSATPGRASSHCSYFSSAKGRH